MELRVLVMYDLVFLTVELRIIFIQSYSRISRFGSVLGVNPRILNLAYFFERYPAKTKKKIVITGMKGMLVPDEQSTLLWYSLESQ
jgi:hypothetical protein